jgi:hypothetical protein
MITRALRILSVLVIAAAAGLMLPAVRASGPPADALDLKVLSRPLNGGRISPMLYGGFVELLDDHVPGMWAEMLGDRGFELGLVPGPAEPLRPGLGQEP